MSASSSLICVFRLSLNGGELTQITVRCCSPSAVSIASILAV